MQAITLFDAIDGNEVKEVTTYAQAGAFVSCLSSSVVLLPFIAEESRLITLCAATLFGGCAGVAQGLYAFHQKKENLN